MIVYLILSIHLQIENRNPQDPTNLEIQFPHNFVNATLLKMGCYFTGLNITPCVLQCFPW